MVMVLSALAISAAAGFRVALPLLLIGLLYSQNLWANVPLLSQMPQPLVLGMLVSWSLAEVVLSKRRLGQRVLQVFHLVLSPVVGAIASITVLRSTQLDVNDGLLWLIGGIGAALALVLQLVQVGWFYQLQGLPLWVVFAQDVLCVVLVCLAFDAPRQGALIALLLLWLTIRSSHEWQKRYRSQAIDPQDAPEQRRWQRQNPRRDKIDPD